MSSAADLLDVARAELGTYEDPKGSNRTPYGAWYGMDGNAWCAMFVSWVADRAGCADVIPRHAYTPDGVAWFKDRGLWVTGGYRPGDVVYYQWATSDRVCHVGYVEAYDGHTLTALEGNTHASGQSSHEDRVMRQYRTAYIVGAGRPDYSQESEAGTLASYYCEVAQNTGQEVSSAGEDIRMQDDRDDDLGWHDEVNNYPSISPDRRIKGNANAWCYVEGGAASVRLRTYSTEGDPMRTIAAQDTPGGYVSLAGYLALSPGQRVRLYVDPKGGAVTVRNAVLSLAARDA